jgi:hypothetical protein
LIPILPRENPQNARPKARLPRHRFNRALLPILLLILLAFACVCLLSSGCLWNRVLDTLHVAQRGRYTSLAVLAAALLGLLAMAKALVSNRRR